MQKVIESKTHGKLYHIKEAERLTGISRTRIRTTLFKDGIINLYSRDGSPRPVYHGIRKGNSDPAYLSEAGLQIIYEGLADGSIRRPQKAGRPRKKVTELLPAVQEIEEKPKTNWEDAWKQSKELEEKAKARQQVQEVKANPSRFVAVAERTSGEAKERPQKSAGIEIIGVTVLGVTISLNVSIE